MSKCDSRVYCEACAGDDRYAHVGKIIIGAGAGPSANLQIKSDQVNKPQHYQFFPDLEAIEVIARSMTQEQFYGYCLGNRLKYRLRAGNKDKLEQDIAKSDKYLELYEQHKGKCIAAKGLGAAAVGGRPRTRRLCICTRLSAYIRIVVTA